MTLLQVAEGPRCRMLETIRDYALERLAESGQSTRPGQSTPRAFSTWPNVPSPACAAPGSRPGSRR